MTQDKEGKIKIRYEDPHYRTIEKLKYITGKRLNLTNLIEMGEYHDSSHPE